MGASERSVEVAGAAMGAGGADGALGSCSGSSCRKLTTKIFDPVTVLQRRFGDLRAVDEGSVGAAEIPNATLTVIAGDGEMP